MSKKFAFVLLVDDNSFLGARVTISGILLHASRPFKIVVFYWNLSQQNKNKIKSMDSNIVFKKIPQEDYKNCKFASFPRNWDYNCAYRFEIFTLCEYDKIVYIDCDFLIQNNISKLFRKNIKFGAVRAEGDCLIQGNKHFNAGLLVIDKEYLNNNIKKELINLCSSAAPLFNDKTEWISDEPVLNFFFKDVSFLEKKYNYLVTTLKINKDKDVNYHFNGDIKPWGKKSFDEAFNSCFFKCFINKNGIKGVIFLKRLFSLYTKILNQN